MPCPPIPGAFSALGLVGSDSKRDYVRTLYATSDPVAPEAMQQAFASLEAAGTAMLDRANVARPAVGSNAPSTRVTSANPTSSRCPSPMARWTSRPLRASPKHSMTAIARHMATTTGPSLSRSSA
ncbi:MAG: hypothetical protein R3D67_16855 [Hyphomicrobiaceae bacterium]